MNQFFASVGEMVVHNQNFVEYKQIDEKIEDGLTEFEMMNVNEF